MARGTCKACEKTNITLPAHGLCMACYDVLYPQGTRKKLTRKKNHQNNGQYPMVIHIKAYKTSDEREFGNEIDALRHQLELERSR